MMTHPWNAKSYKLMLKLSVNLMKKRRGIRTDPDSSTKNTTKRNMSDPVFAPMACNIVANDILKTA